MHLICLPLPPPPPPQKKNWHKHWFQFLLGRLLYPGEMKNKNYEKFGGSNKVHRKMCKLVCCFGGKNKQDTAIQNLHNLL